MSRQCIVERCGMCRKDGYTLYRFPDPLRHKKKFVQWCRAAGVSRKKLSDEYIRSVFRICEVHFEGKYVTRGKSLVGVSVPTLFLPGCNEMPSEQEKKEEVTSETTDTPKLSFTQPVKKTYKRDAMKDYYKTLVESNFLNDWDSGDRFNEMPLEQEQKEEVTSETTDTPELSFTQPVKKTYKRDAMKDTTEEGEVLDVSSLKAREPDGILAEACNESDQYEDLEFSEDELPEEEILENSRILEKTTAFSLFGENLDNLVIFLNSCKEDRFTTEQIACLQNNITAILDFAKSNFRKGETSK